MVAGILEYSALAIFYSVLAAAMLEGLLHLWRVQDPPLALSFRLPILALPPVAPLLLALLSPDRASDPFRPERALLDLRNWLGPEPSLSHPAWTLLLAVMAATTLLLIALEVVGSLRQLLSHKTPQPIESLPDKLQQAVAGLAARGVPPFPVLLLDQPEPMAWALGLRHPTILVTTGLVGLLDEEELEGVLAHEMAHVWRRDNWLGWLIFGLRLVSFYNPVVLLAFHQIGHDTEKVCDAQAGMVTGKPLALASALIKVYRSSTTSLQPTGSRLRHLRRQRAALENRARRTLVEDRVERLIHPEAVTHTSYPELRLGLALAAVLGLMYFVV